VVLPEAGMAAIPTRNQDAVWPCSGEKLRV
jgi:hypothetical protein